MSICSVNSYCGNNGDVYMECYKLLWQLLGLKYGVLKVIVTIMGRSMCIGSSYCDNNDNNGEVYLQC